MKLQKYIDSEIQKKLLINDISFPLDSDGLIFICEYRIDTKAKAGMLYLIPKSSVPEGEFKFLVSPAPYIYGIFHEKGNALIIEICTLAMENN